MKTLSLSLVAVTGLLCALAATSCGGSSTKSTSATSSTTTTTGAAGAGSSSAAELQALATQVQGAKGATFAATWTSTSSSGTATVTLEQQPPKSVFKTSGSGSEEIISTGTATYFCSTGSGSASTCVSEKGPNPLASLIGLYTGSTFLTAMQGFQAQVAARVAGVDVHFSDATYAGLSARCVSVSANGQSYKWCVAHAGVLVYASSSGSTFQLTSYSSNVSSADFNLPAGATVVTTP